MKALLIFTVSTLIAGTTATAGIPSQDPVTYYLKLDFKKASTPTKAQLHFGKKWVCSEVSAIKDDFTSLKNQRSYLFSKSSDVIKNSGAASVKIFSNTNDELIGLNSGIKSTVRIAENGDLIVERQQESDTESVVIGYSFCQLNVEPENSCGVNGTIDERIEHCNRTKQAASGAKWSLVTRTEQRNEIWRDDLMGLFWGDYAGSLSNTNAINTCEKDSSLDAKGGISEIAWHLPTLREVKHGEKNGMREVLPNMPGYFFWTASKPFSLFKKRDDAWGFFGHSGTIDYYTRKGESSFRCVGQ